ncbi:hypothetical protein [Lacticaseibacillus camelliae]|uniref:Uncharacterized protein n=1 Tax=Lacticaseibacillus camelliae DSM 22697 = JCM 13995 TaxID=1423730 RepID=A0A0R2EY45_9LACO|nr:hypothetical protein [Lacticaseibacillus camelliae]KRN21327.1 hypothetical protein FC75_GL002340 [Lacticaseibacillus camelliae DSM 22697 = JCM 13995]
MQHQKRWLTLSAVCVAVLAVIGWYAYGQRQRGLIDGTSTTAALTSQKQFYQQFTKQYPALKPALDHDAKPDTYVIPGLGQTKSLTTGVKGQVGISKTMDPQGLTVTPKYVVISAYSRDNQYDSVLYFLSKRSGRFVKQMVLPNASHVGGLAYDPVSKRLWVTTETAQNTASLSAYDAKTWQQANFAHGHHASQFDQVVSLNRVKRASFLTYHNNALYVGFFDQSTQGSFVALPLTEQGMPDVANRRRVELRGANHPGSYTTSKRLQGVTFYHGEILFSQSFGPNSSSILAFDNDGQRTWLDFDGDDTLKTVKLPPYLEQIYADGEDLYVLFESGSARYRKAKLGLHADRVVKLDLGNLMK